METGLLHLHSLLRWVILLLLFVALYRSLFGNRNVFSAGDRRTGLFLLISCDIMLAVGLVQWIKTSELGLKAIQNNGMSAVMKNAVPRFFAIEHFLGMLIAIILVHIGYSYGKRALPDNVKHRR